MPRSVRDGATQTRSVGKALDRGQLASVAVTTYEVAR